MNGSGTNTMKKDNYLCSATFVIPDGSTISYYSLVHIASVFMSEIELVHLICSKEFPAATRKTRKLDFKQRTWPMLDALSVLMTALGGAVREERDPTIPHMGEVYFPDHL